MADSGSSGTPTWSCAGNICTTSNALASGASYPPITVTVNVAVNAPLQVTNQVSVSGGGPGTAAASDSTTTSRLKWDEPDASRRTNAASLALPLVLILYTSCYFRTEPRPSVPR